VPREEPSRERAPALAYSFFACAWVWNYSEAV
jgi:hypothetical protein